LLLDESGTVKISDFGVAQQFEGDDDRLHRTVGTPAFYAPELCSAASTPRGRPADIWALGVTLYCLVFGRVPFVAEHLMHLYDTIRTQPVEYPRDIDPLLRDLLGHLLEKNLEKRIAIDEIERHPWFVVEPST
jgi:serine/threonine protein kinase